MIFSSGAGTTQLNPYDPYVANKLINVNHMVMVCHVDDIKVIHKNKNIFTRVAK